MQGSKLMKQPTGRKRSLPELQPMLALQLYAISFIGTRGSVTRRRRDDQVCKLCRNRCRGHDTTFNKVYGHLPIGAVAAPAREREAAERQHIGHGARCFTESGT